MSGQGYDPRHQHQWYETWVRDGEHGSVDVKICLVTGCDETRTL